MVNESELFAMINEVDEGELLHFWMYYSDELSDFIYVKSTESTNRKIPYIEKTIPIHQSGEIYIEGLFLSDKFLFLNDEIARLNYKGMPVRFACDVSVSIDLNLLKYMSNLIEGYQNATSYVAFHAIRYLVSNNINYDFNLYYWENYQRLNHDNVYKSKNFLNNMRAAEIIKDLDEKHFLTSGEVRPRCSEKEILERVNKSIDSQSALLKVIPEFYSAIWKLTYLSILFTIFLKYSRNKGKSDILGNLLRFYDEEIGLMLLRDFFYSKYFLENQNSSFFSFVQPKNPNFFHKLKGLAGDLHIFRVMERFSSQSHQSDFMIPYVMTYDKRYSDMMKVFKLQSLFYKKGSVPLASPTLDIQEYIIKNGEWSEFFKKEKHLKRQQNLKNEGDFDVLISKYEILVANLLGVPAPQ